MAPPKSLSAFVASLPLSLDQAQALESHLVKDSQVAAFLKSRDGTNNGGASTISPACYTLEKVLGPDVVNTTPNIQTDVEVNWSQACWEEPACIIRVRSAQDVSTALKVIEFFKVTFAVRSGGHSPNPGWSSIKQPGILIDLARLDQVTVSDDHKTVVVGPGQRWGSVYEALDPYGVSVVGGRISHVGVGGLILGGGYFHFFNFGLAADNVKRFEIVLSDGTITNATAEQNSDLFWALKGGGPNFGIVTAFELYTIPVRDIWYEVRVFTNDNVPALLDAFAAWQKIPNEDIKASANMVISLQGAALALLYSSPVDQRPAAFDVFNDIIAAHGIPLIPPTKGTIVSWTQLASASIPITPERHDYRSAASKIDAQLYKDVYEVWQKQAIAVNAATGAKQTFVVQPFTKNLVKQGIEKGGNPLGMPFDGLQCWTSLIDWQNAADDDEVRSVGINTTNAWNTLSAERGLDVSFLYMGDSSRDQNPLASYGPANVARLKEVSAKYDPAQVFQVLPNDGFLLRKA